MRMQWLAVLLLCSGSAIANCKIETDQKRNADGSELRITQTQCDQHNQRTILIELRADPISPYTTVLQRNQSLSEFPRGFGHLKDIDDDGILEYDEVENCGAGPNCWHSIFRIDPKQARAWLLVKGGFSDVRKISDFYVTSGRSSCCSWEHQVYAKPDGQRSVDEEDLRYLISVSSGLTLRAGTTDQYITTCRISRPKGESWAPVDPDSKELLQLCEIYGKDYILNPPDAAAQNQLHQRGQAGK